jgi:hypothetical protein
VDNQRWIDALAAGNISSETRSLRRSPVGAARVGKASRNGDIAERLLDRGRDEMAALASNASWQRLIRTINGQR